MIGKKNPKKILIFQKFWKNSRIFNEYFSYEEIKIKFEAKKKKRIIRVNPKVTDFG